MVDWGALFQAPQEAHLRNLDDPPVGEVCNHGRLKGFCPIQNPRYARDDNGANIYYHSYRVVMKDGTPTLERCGKPEIWQWKYYAARCDVCDKTYSNPWVPLCEECWDEPSPYPSWAFVISQES